MSFSNQCWINRIYLYSLQENERRTLCRRHCACLNSPAKIPVSLFPMIPLLPKVRRRMGGKSCFFMNVRATIFKNDAVVVIKSICWEILKVEGMEVAGLFFKCELEDVYFCMHTLQPMMFRILYLSWLMMFYKNKNFFFSFLCCPLPQYHHFSSLALHKSQHPFKKDNAVLVDFSFRGGHIIVDFSFSFPFFLNVWHDCEVITR